MRVLVIEPSAGLRQIFSLELEEAGFSAIGAESSEEAMRLASEDPPDAIVLNATVAPASGAQFIRHLRSDGRLGSVPVVGMAFAPGSERSLLEAGADCCLRALPLRGDVLKAIHWAVSVYGERRDP